MPKMPFWGPKKKSSAGTPHITVNFFFVLTIFYLLGPKIGGHEIALFTPHNSSTHQFLVHPKKKIFEAMVHNFFRFPYYESLTLAYISPIYRLKKNIFPTHTRMCAKAII
jgi:hypothetical protein